MTRRKNQRYLADEFDDFDDQYYDDEEQTEQDDPEQLRSYYCRPSDSSALQREADHDPSQDDLVDVLTEEFRAVLQHERLSRDQVDAVLVASDYDVEIALNTLKREFEEEGRRSQESSTRLESSQPSAIGQMMDGDETRYREARISDQSEASKTFGTVNSGTVHAADTQDVKRFSFDGPSPDDLVRQKQWQGHERSALARSLTGAAGASRPASSSSFTSKQDDVKRVGSTKFSGDAGQRGSFSLPKPSPRKSGHPSRAAMDGDNSERNVKKDALVHQRGKDIPLPKPEDTAHASNSRCVVFAGHVDAGKSTLLGHLLRLRGIDEKEKSWMSKSRVSVTRNNEPLQASKLAWMTDTDEVEQERGVTTDIATRRFRGTENGRVFCVIDAPGHRDYVPAMILGACHADAAILVVDASPGEFEAGFSEQGQTREHTVLLRALGISQIVVAVNKMDTVDYSQMRFNDIREKLTAYLKSMRWKAEKNVVYVPCSGSSGINLVDGPPENHSLNSWYNGPTVLSALEALPMGCVELVTDACAEPTRFVVSDCYRSSTLGGTIAVSGRLISGTIALKDKLAVKPSSEIGCVKSIEVDGKAMQARGSVVAAGMNNSPISLGLDDVSNALMISPGDVLCDPMNPVPVKDRFRGRVVVIDSTVAVMQGMQVELHMAGRFEEATISKLVELLDSRSGGESATGGGNVALDHRKRPRRLMKGDAAVIEVSASRPVCVTVAKDTRMLGRFVLRRQGHTVAAGIVIELGTDKKQRKQDRPDPGKESPSHIHVG